MCSGLCTIAWDVTSPWGSPSLDWDLNGLYFLFLPFGVISNPVCSRRAAWSRVTFSSPPGMVLYVRLGRCQHSCCQTPATNPWTIPCTWVSIGAPTCPSPNAGAPLRHLSRTAGVAAGTLYLMHLILLSHQDSPSAPIVSASASCRIVHQGGFPPICAGNIHLFSGAGRRQRRADPSESRHVIYCIRLLFSFCPRPLLWTPHWGPYSRNAEDTARWFQVKTLLESMLFYLEAIKFLLVNWKWTILYIILHTLGKTWINERNIVNILWESHWKQVFVHWATQCGECY